MATTASTPAPNVPAALPVIAATAAATVVALADQCVQCGLCLPQCPTYRLAAHEAESPRGRIALAKGVASGELAADASLRRHLDQCLACRSCEAVCPSGVRYDDLLGQTRALLRAAGGFSSPIRAWLRNPRWLRRLARLAVVLRAQRWAPAWAGVLPRSSLVRRILETVPAPPPPVQGSSRRTAPPMRGRIALFRGCVADVYDADTLSAARVLLEASGYEVVETRGGDCCGALARHAGDAGAAARQAAATRRALERSEAPIVLVTASGCFGDLRDHVVGGVHPQHSQPNMSLRVDDIHAFLVADAGFARRSFRPLARTVALHVPCTQTNVAGGVAAIRGLLARIPGLVVTELPAQPRCCGAAGSYYLEHPDIADRLRSDQLAQYAASGAGTLLTSNIGCRLHLANGLRRDATVGAVLHPLVLLAQQLDNAEP